MTFGDGNGTRCPQNALSTSTWHLSSSLYGAQPVAGMTYLHGKKGKALVHIGAIDAPVTIEDVNDAIDECLRVNQSELHVLGMGMGDGSCRAEQ